MPFAYPAPHLLKARIVERAALGETVKAICAEAGMPSKDSVQVWRRADPGFAAELAQARRVGDHRRRLAFDEAKAAAFLARVRAGARIRDVLAKPGMPSQKTYAHWRLTEASFQEALWALKGVRDKERGLRLKARYRPFDQATADRIFVRVVRGEGLRRMLETDPSLPCRAVVYRWRKEEPEWDRAMRKAFGWGRRARGGLRSPELTDRIVARLVQGASLRSLAQEPGMPAAGTLYSWVSRDADFAAEVAQACDWREDWYEDQMQMIVDEAGPIGVQALRRQLSPLAVRRGQLQHRPGRRWRGSA